MLLIFGGNGFIGRHLCAMLAPLRQDIVVVSRNPDKDFFSATCPTANLLTLEAFEADKASILSAATTMIYLASTSVPSSNISAPWREYEDNVVPALKLFAELSHHAPQARLIFSSSGGTVYGDGHTAPIPEGAELRPISPYGLGKVAVEQGIRYLHDTKGLVYSILRIANPVGYWQTNPRQGLVNAVLCALTAGEPVAIYGQGAQVRDYLAADDVAQAIIACIHDHSVRSYIFNIGSGKGRTTREIVDLCAAITGAQPDLKFLPPRPVDTGYVVLDVTHASNEIGWRAQASLEAEIERMWRRRF